MTYLKGRPGLFLVAIVSPLAVLLLSPMPALAQTEQDFGSIAYSPAQRVYTSAVADTESHAEWAAVAKCKTKGASDCQAFLWFKNNWGALARGDNDAFGTGYGTSQDFATSNSLDICKEHGGQNCNVIYEGHTPTVSETPAGGTPTPDEAIPLIPNDITNELEKAIGPAINCGIGFSKIGELVDHLQNVYNLSRGDLDAYARDFIFGRFCLNDVPEMAS